MKNATPHELVCDSDLTPHFLETMGRIVLDTTRDGGNDATVSATVSCSPRRSAIATIAIHQAVKYYRECR
ncbi:hypothetical protein [Nostoc sp.]|uniref:hypothetical protein n=1 Tax=Nostoc sp. TaxID=1180 RepID=UPI002FF8EDF4